MTGSSIKMIGGYWPAVAVVSVLVGLVGWAVRMQAQVSSDGEKIEGLTRKTDTQDTILRNIEIDRAENRVRLAAIEKSLAELRAGQEKLLVKIEQIGQRTGNYALPPDR